MDVHLYFDLYRARACWWLSEWSTMEEYVDASFASTAITTLPSSYVIRLSNQYPDTTSHPMMINIRINGSKSGWGLRGLRVHGFEHFV